MRRSLNVGVFAAAALLGALAVSGCVSLLPKTRPAQLYRFGESGGSTPAPAPRDAASPERLGLVLASIGFPRESTSDGILTVSGDRTAYISGARWVAPARILFQEAAQRQFQSRLRRVELVNIGDAGPAAVILRLDVSAFEVDYQTAGPVVTVRLNARLARSDGRLLDQRDFSVVKPASSDSVSAMVQAFDDATGSILADIGGWTDSQVDRMLASDTPPPPPPGEASTGSTTTTVQTTHP